MGPSSVVDDRIPGRGDACVASGGWGTNEQTRTEPIGTEPIGTERMRTNGWGNRITTRVTARQPSQKVARIIGADRAFRPLTIRLPPATLRRAQVLHPRACKP
jgi:hypothetical protein